MSQATDPTSHTFVRWAYTRYARPCHLQIIVGPSSVVVTRDGFSLLRLLSEHSNLYGLFRGVYESMQLLPRS